MIILCLIAIFLLSLLLFTFWIVGPLMIYSIREAWKEWKEIFKRGD